MFETIRKEEHRQFISGVIACLPTIPGYWSIGFAAGAIGTLSGFSPLETTLLAGVLYAGSSTVPFLLFMGHGGRDGFTYH